MTSEATSRQASTVASAAAEPKQGWLHRIGGKAFSRIGWGLTDQAVSSLTNFAVSFYLAHTLVAAQFGAFSIGQAALGELLPTNSLRRLSQSSIFTPCFFMMKPCCITDSVLFQLQ